MVTGFVMNGFAFSLTLFGLSLLVLVILAEVIQTVSRIPSPTPFISTIKW